MADITWSAYALAMFTPEQLAAAAGAVLPTEEPIIIRPPVGPITRGTFGIRIEGLDPNVPAEIQEIHRRGWTFRNGEWLKLGTVVNPDPIGAGTVLVAGSSSFMPSGAVASSGSVLGVTVPSAPAVLLPSFVGGRLGHINLGAGMRPESGGTERVRIGRVADFPQVRF